MQLALAKIGKAKSGTVELSDSAFGKEYNEDLVHQVVVAYLSGARQGTRAQKTRSEVSGGGAKPWRQKGTGRARAGTIRSPLWRSGGVTFAKKNQDFSQKVNRKMYRSALRSILSELARQDRLIAIQSFELEGPKTKDLVAKLNELNVSKALIITEQVDNNLYLSSRNIPGVDVIDVQAADPVSLVANEKIIITVDALKKFDEVLG